MKAMMLVPVLAVAVGVAAGRAEVTSFYELKTMTLAGKPADLKDYAGKRSTRSSSRKGSSASGSRATTSAGRSPGRRKRSRRSAS